MACLRFLAKCPCPMCLVQKQQIALMGSKRDAINCRQKRVDDEKTQGLISMAREWVFEKGYRIGSAMIGRLLNGLSLVPTRVSIFVTISGLHDIDTYSEHILTTICTIRCELLLDVCPRPLARVRNWCFQSILRSHLAGVVFLWHRQARNLKQPVSSYRFVRQDNRTCSCSRQLPKDPHFWPRCHSQIHERCLRKAWLCRTRL